MQQTDAKRYRCLLCGHVWLESETHSSSRHNSRTCGDSFCGATCVPLPYTAPNPEQPCENSPPPK